MRNSQNYAPLSKSSSLMMAFKDEFKEEVEAEAVKALTSSATAIVAIWAKSLMHSSNSRVK